MSCTETRTYVGQPGSPAFDGWAGFVIGQQYVLCLERVDGQVFILYVRDAPEIGPLVVSEAQFEKWWVR